MQIGEKFEAIMHGKDFDRDQVFATYYRRRLRKFRLDGLSLDSARDIARDFATRDTSRAAELYTAIQDRRERDLAGEPERYSKWQIERDAKEQAFRDRRPTGKYRLNRRDHGK